MLACGMVPRRNRFRAIIVIILSNSSPVPDFMPNHPVLSAPALPIRGQGHQPCRLFPSPPSRTSLALVTHREVIQRDNAPESDHTGASAPITAPSACPSGADFGIIRPHTHQRGHDDGIRYRCTPPLGQGPARDAGTTHLLLRDGAVALPQALDRILAEEISSPLRPPFDNNAAMDGMPCAWRISPPRCRSPVAGKAFAGQPYEGSGPPATASAS